MEYIKDFADKLTDKDNSGMIFSTVDLFESVFYALREDRDNSFLELTGLDFFDVNAYIGRWMSEDIDIPYSTYDFKFTGNTISVIMTEELHNFLGKLADMPKNKSGSALHVAVELIRDESTLVHKYVNELRAELYVDEEGFVEGDLEVDEVFGSNISERLFKREIKVKEMVGRNAESRLLSILTSKKYPKNILLEGSTGIGKSLIIENFQLKYPERLGIMEMYGSNVAPVNFFNAVEKVMKKTEAQYIYIKGFDDLFVDKDIKEAMAALQSLGALSNTSNVRFIVTMDLKSSKIVPTGYDIVRIQPIPKEQILDVLKHEVESMLEGSGVHVEGGCLEEFVLSVYKGNIDSVIDKVDTLIALAKEVYNGELNDRAVDVFRRTMIGLPSESEEVKEAGNLKGIRERIESRLIGQEDAVEKVVRAIKRNKAGVRIGNRPVGTFLFVGPTGVGKTELVKVLAKELTGTTNSIIRFDMSEFSEGHSVSKLIGSPPGYVGHDDGGQLTKRIKERPESIVLFDEIEKAHGNVFNMMLQIMDEGRLTDSRGETVDFTKAIVIMTSNAGYSAEANGKRSIGFSAMEFDENKMANEQVLTALESTFRPEFLNRIDSVVKFNRLRYEEILKISTLMVGDVVENLKKKGYSIKVGEEVYEHISKVGFSDKYGARNIKRAIQEEIEDYLADCIIDEGLDKTVEYTLGVTEGKVQFI